MAGDKPNPTQRPAPARGPGGGALQQRKRPARTATSCVEIKHDGVEDDAMIQHERAVKF